MLNCNTFVTNAPIICNTLDEATEYATLKQRPLQHVDPLDLIATLKASSGDGSWCVVDCSSVETDALRDAVAVVWLQGNWDHHRDFRAWFVHQPFLTPLTSQFTLDNTSNGFTLSPARGSSVATRLRVEAANAHLPLSLVTGAVYLKYTDNFEDEFNVRSLVNAVGNSQLFYTKEFRHFMTVLNPRYLMGLFRLASREDVFVALAEQGVCDEGAKKMIVSARGDANDSIMDIALKKECIEGAQVLRDLGCMSDAFDFTDLLKPSFATALRVLLQPDKPFPFNPVRTVSFVAREGHAEILRRLFHCRIDSSFEHSDYPLAEACLSGSEEIVWIVLDRMGSTGVSPLTEPRWAFFHLLRMVSEAAVPKTSTGSSALVHSTSSVFVIDDLSLKYIRKFVSIVEEEGGKHHIPVGVMTRMVAYPDVMQSFMRIMDPHLEPNAPALLEFFAEFDPNNEHVESMVRRAYREMPKRLASRPIEVDVYFLLWHLLRQGAPARQMYQIAVDCCVHYGYLDFTFRGDGGDTLLHKAIKCDIVDAEALGFTFYRMSERDRINLINAEDSAGRGGIDSLVSKVLSVPLTPAEEESVADAIRLMLYAGGSIPLEKASVAYERCISIGYPLIAFELLKASGKRFDFSSLPKNIALSMATRYRTAPALNEDRFKEVVEMASDCLSIDEIRAIRQSAGTEPRLPISVTLEIDQRLESNALPFKGSSRDQQRILGAIIDYLDRPSFNGFHDLCFATHFATMGKPLPPRLPTVEILGGSSEAKINVVEAVEKSEPPRETDCNEALVSSHAEESHQENEL